jgi:hypothetical protein
MLTMFRVGNSITSFFSIDVPKNIDQSSVDRVMRSELHVLVDSGMKVKDIGITPFATACL